MRFFLIFLLATLLTNLSASWAQDPALEPKQPIDYSVVVGNASWNWPRLGSLLTCLGLLRSRNKYQGRIETQVDSLALAITILDDQNELYSWQGHYETVFCVNDGVLFFADWSLVGTGGEIVAVKLSNGKEIWRRKLDALGDIAHYGYSNRIRIEYQSGAVWVWGKESFGNYVELKNPKTGETITQKIFDKNEK